MAESVFVTGADKGLGLCLVRVFLDHGFRVFAGCYGLGDSLKPLAGPFADSLHIIPQDITDMASVVRSARQVGELTDSLDILINNAGIHIKVDKQLLPEIDLADGHMEKMMATNAFGPLRVVQQFLPLLQRGRGKRIVNISSEAGSIRDSGRTSWFGYCMSKAALNMQTSILQRYLAPEGFKLLAIHPGWMRTDMGGDEADMPPDASAAAVFRLATREWTLDDPVYMDHTGKPLNW